MKTLLLAGLFLVCTAAGAANESVTNLLFINSYHRGYKWSDDIEAGLRERLVESGKKIELSFEYLDSRRFTYGDQIPSIAGSMAVKYARYRPGVVVVSDNAAFDFAVAQRERLFPGVPIVFGGYNNFRPDDVRGVTNLTGINEEVDFSKTIEMALSLHPGTTTLAFIVSTADVSNRRNAREIEETVLPRFRDRYRVEVIQDALLTDVQQKLARLPANSLLFLSGQVRDQFAGRTLTPEENARLIAGISPVPAYTFWDFHIGNGAIGGRVLKGYDQGRAMADLALRILEGERADAIPVTMTSPARNLFDYPVMARFGLKLADLPTESQVINRPDSAWEKYFAQIVGVILFVLLQTLLLLGLIYNMRLRRKAMAALGDFARAQNLAIETERRSLAREVHDQIGQVFTAIKLIIDARPRNAFSPEQEKALAQALDMGIAATRRVTAELRPPLLDDLGLAAAVDHYVKHHPGLEQIQCRVAIYSEDLLDTTQSLTLFRIIQEAVTNVVRHAQAKHLTITGVADKGYLLKIADDGCGMDPSSIRPDALGLTGMRERAHLVDGKFTLHTRPNEGTAIEVRLPETGAA